MRCHDSWDFTTKSHDKIESLQDGARDRGAVQVQPVRVLLGHQDGGGGTLRQGAPQGAVLHDQASWIYRTQLVDIKC